MNRRDLLRAGAVAAASGIAGCLGTSSGPTFEEGFESGLGEWGRDAAIGPEVDLPDFEWHIEVSAEQAHDGGHSLRIFNEGDHDDGTCWAVRPISIDPGRYTATATVEFWSESESFNTLRDAVVRLGPEPPQAEEDFPNPGVNTSALGQTPYGGLREPLWLADGWRAYQFEWTTPALSTDTLYLAVGTSVIWEGDATHYADAITVELSPD